MYAGIDQIVLTESYRASAVCRSGFYAWRSQEESLREKDDRETGPLVDEIFWRHRRRYGARRIVVELSRRGLACGVARVARLLKTRGLQAIQPKSFRPRSTESRYRLGYNTNVLADRAAPVRINVVRVGDITYIPLGTRTREGRFGYLALLMDLSSRRVVGWSYQDSMGEDLVLAALRRAIRDRQPVGGLFHHANRGGQYASREYRDVLRRSGKVQNMSAAGNCYDNAFMESCFGTMNDGAGIGGVPERCRSAARAGFVHRTLQRRAVTLLARVREHNRVRTPTTRPKKALGLFAQTEAPQNRAAGT